MRLQDIKSEGMGCGGLFSFCDTISVCSVEVGLGETLASFRPLEIDSIGKPADGGRSDQMIVEKIKDSPA